MVIMALDHARAYFNYGTFFLDPTNLETTTPFLFFTRFITHYCAPVFVFLAGTSAFLYGSKKTKPELFKFLFTRGLWLIFLEVVVNNLIWTFDLTYSLQIFQVIWAIGFSMVCLSFLMYLPKKIILGLGIVLVVGHNLLDGFVFQGQTSQSIIWYVLHQSKLVIFDPSNINYFHYPVIPWVGLMALGYVFGNFYKKDFNAIVRKKWLIGLGLVVLTLFFVLRAINSYGDLVPWSFQDTTTKTILSFFNVTKYPPSLLFMCITMGPALIFLYAFESAKNKVTDFFLVFGRVPLLYYFLHVLVIHIFAVLVLMISGGEGLDMILNSDNFLNKKLSTYGYSLTVVYIVWALVVLSTLPYL